MPDRAPPRAVRLLSGAAVLLAMIACQAPAPSAPTAAPAPPPTATSAPPTRPAAPAASPSNAASAAASPSPAPSPASVASPAATVATVAAVPVGATRLEVLAAANDAFQKGNLAAAAQLYERVTNTPPAAGESPSLTAAIDGLARFRDIVTLLAAGREADARDQLDALQKDPTNPFARLASQLWDQYSMTAQVRAACAQLQPQISSQLGPALATLQAAGLTVDPRTLCSPP